MDNEIQTVSFNLQTTSYGQLLRSIKQELQKVAHRNNYHSSDVEYAVKYFNLFQF